MKQKLHRYLAGLCALGGIAHAALADDTSNRKWLEEARIGLFQHNTCVLECTDSNKNINKEDGPNIEGELVFASPKFLKRLWQPRPYAVASINTAGATSHAGVGLHWNLKLGGKFSLEPGLGYVLHDGAKEVPYPRFDPRNVTFNEENVLYGSRDVFRTSLSLTYDITPKIAAQLTFEHLSHGHIIGSGHNQGLDNLGVRLAWRL